MERKVLILCGSIRSKNTNKAMLLDVVSRSKDLTAYQDNIKECLSNGVSLCNSEIIAGAAAVGCLEYSVGIEYFSLNSLFPSTESRIFDCKEPINVDNIANTNTLQIDQSKLNNLLDILRKCSGIVLATPVYFGDRSSVANKFMQFASMRDSVKNKVFGVVSVGAKRNGGQETCDIFSLYEMLHHGAYAVGNGDPTSQYGGTAVGGDKGSVVNDDWGLRTAYGTGQRVAQVSCLLNARAAVPESPTRIVFLVAMDTKASAVKKYVQSLVEQVKPDLQNVEFSLINLVDLTIYRCLGCQKCPVAKKNNADEGCCIITDPDDCLETIRESLIQSDGIVICGVNSTDLNDFVTRYQVFTERSRFIRRNNYQMTNRLVTSLCYHYFGSTINPIHSLKVMTSYVRHNVVMHKPIELFEYDGKLLKSGYNEVLEFCKAAEQLANGRRQFNEPTPNYNPYGEGGGYMKQ